LWYPSSTYFDFTQSFPNEKTTIFSLISNLDQQCFDVAVRFCDATFAARILQYLSNQLVQNLGAVQATYSLNKPRQESHMIHDDSEIIKIKEVVKALATYLQDEMLIQSSEQFDKIQAARNGLFQVSSDFAGYVVEASLRLNYSSRVNAYLADLFIYLRWLANSDEAFQHRIGEMLRTSIVVQPGHIETANAILLEFFEAYRGLSLNFISINKFREIYSSFVSKLIEQVIKSA
jgi:hypothetical protein